MSQQQQQPEQQQEQQLLQQQGGEGGGGGEEDRLVVVLDRRFPSEPFDVDAVLAPALSHPSPTSTATSSTSTSASAPSATAAVEAAAAGNTVPRIHVVCTQFTSRSAVLAALAALEESESELATSTTTTETEEMSVAALAAAVRAADSHSGDSHGSGSDGGSGSGSGSGSGAADAAVAAAVGALRARALRRADAVLAWHHVRDIDGALLGRIAGEKKQQPDEKKQQQQQPETEKQRQVRWQSLVRLGAGFDNVDVAAARAHGVVVSNVPDYGVDEVADSALCLLLSLMRRTFFVGRATTVRDGTAAWPMEAAHGAVRVAGRTLGIVGLGCIGAAFCRRAQACGMRVVCYDPYLPRGAEKSWGIAHRYEDLHEMLRHSHAVSLHCPLRGARFDNTDLIDATALAAMPKGGYLINTARGPIVNEPALVDALKSGHLAGAALDVAAEEPYPADGPLRTLDSVILTPHTAFYSDESVHEMQTHAAQEVRRALDKQRRWYRVGGADDPYAA